MAILKRGAAGLDVATNISLLLVVTVILASTAHAVGITVPKVYKWDFTPNFEKQVGFHIYNSFDHPQRVVITLSGPLLAYGNVTPSEIVLDPNGVGDIVVSLKLPADIPPGEQVLWITATEATPEGGGISAVTAVRVFLQVTKPYTGKYLKATLEVPSITENETVRPVLTLENLGTDDVPDAYGTIVVQDAQTNRSAGTTQTNHTSLNAHSKAVLPAELPNILKAGVYGATATAYGGDNSATASTRFTVGAMDVNLISVSDTFVIGKVNPVDFTIMNRWNANINNVKVTIFIGDDKRNWRAAGPDLLLYPWQETQGEYFVSISPDAPPGTYPGYVELSFAGKTRRFPQTFRLKAAGAELESPATANPLLNIARLSFVLLFIVIIFLYMRQRKKERVNK